MRGYPTWFMPLILSAMGAGFVTGALLLPGFLYVRLEWEVPWRLPSDARIGIAAAHLLSGCLALVILGALWSVHVRTHWRHREHRQSGLTTATCLLVLAVTGAGIYYLSGEESSLAASGSHVLVGVMFGVIFSWHALVGRRARRSRAASRL